MRDITHWVNAQFMTVTKSTTNDFIHIYDINQDARVSNARTTFILDNSNFTKEGVKQINESIRTYCWAILGSQSQTRTDILGTCTAFDAQNSS